MSKLFSKYKKNLIKKKDIKFYKQEKNNFIQSKMCLNKTVPDREK